MRETPTPCVRPKRRGPTLFVWLMIALLALALMGAVLLLLGVTRYDAPPVWDGFGMAERWIL